MFIVHHPSPSFRWWSNRLWRRKGTHIYIHICIPTYIRVYTLTPIYQHIVHDACSRPLSATLISTHLYIYTYICI